MNIIGINKFGNICNWLLVSQQQVSAESHRPNSFQQAYSLASYILQSNGGVCGRALNYGDMFESLYDLRIFILHFRCSYLLPENPGTQ